MLVLIFKYLMPPLVGYVVFAGVSGKLNPLSKPRHPKHRPGWLLGLCSGVSAMLALGIVGQIIYAVSPSSAQKLWIPSVSVVACTLIAGLVLYLVHPRRAHQLSARNTSASPVKSYSTEQSKEQAISSDVLMGKQNLSNTNRSDTDKVTPAYLAKARLHFLNTDKPPEAVNEPNRPLVNVAAPRDSSSLSEIEQRLSQSINDKQLLETDNLRERKRAELAESKLQDLKHELVKAKQEIRCSAAARAKALSTANKSIAFARQAIQIRARLESEMHTTQENLKNRQATIDSLIHILEKEKHLTQQDVKSIAKQLATTEQTLKPRKPVEKDIANEDKQARFVKNATNS